MSPVARYPSQLSSKELTVFTTHPENDCGLSFQEDSAFLQSYFSSDYDSGSVFDTKESFLLSFRKQFPKPSQTLTAWLHITNACNLRCPYCYIHKTPDAMELAHGKQAVDAIIRSAVNNNFTAVKIKYAGGEATLNMRTVLELHAYAQKQTDLHDLALDGVVLSNGVFAASVVDKLKEAELRIMISLDGVGKAHDDQRPLPSGLGSFHYVEQTLDRLQEANIIPSISITLTQKNAKRLPETVKYVLDRGLPFTLNFFRDNECASTFDDLQFEEGEIIAAMKAAYAVIEDNLPSYSLLGSLLDKTNLHAPHQRPCGAAQNYLVIDQNGGVAKCQMEINDTVTNIWSADPLADLRLDKGGLQNLSVDEKEGCRDCEWKNWCAGGCPALTYRATGRFDVKSPNCNIYKALFPEVLRLEKLRILQYAQQRELV